MGRCVLKQGRKQRGTRHNQHQLLHALPGQTPLWLLLHALKESLGKHALGKAPDRQQGGRKGESLPKRSSRAAPSAAQWEKCSSTRIWYAKGMHRAPATAGSSRRDHTGTFVVYSGTETSSRTRMQETPACYRDAGRAGAGFRQHSADPRHLCLAGYKRMGQET